MLKRGDRLGHYKILSAVGEGTVTEVYEAEDEQLRRRVALKVLQKNASRDPHVVERFKQEARELASVNHHAIVPILQYGEIDGLQYCTMPYLSGGNLRAHLQRGLTPVQTLRVMREVALALGHAHRQGLLHRDLKPENIQFSEQGDPAVSDFGLSRALRQDLDSSATSVSVEDPRYMSPEQARGFAEDERSDLYSFGLVLYEALTGRAAFDGEDPLEVMLQQVSEPPPPLDAEHGEIQVLMDRLLAKDPEQRPANAEEVAEELLGLTQTGQFEAGELQAAPAEALPTAQPALVIGRESMAEMIARARRAKLETLGVGAAAGGAGGLWRHLAVVLLGGLVALALAAWLLLA